MNRMAGLEPSGPLLGQSSQPGETTRAGPPPKTTGVEVLLVNHPWPHPFERETLTSSLDKSQNSRPAQTIMYCLCLLKGVAKVANTALVSLSSSSDPQGNFRVQAYVFYVFCLVTRTCIGFIVIGIEDSKACKLVAR